VVRCAQHLGFNGFQDLKISLARELGAAAVIATPAEASPGSLLDEVLVRAEAAVRSASRTIDREQFAAAMHAVDNAGHVLLIGIGTSAPVAQDGAFRLRVIGVPADAPTEIYAQQMQASALGPDDVLLAVSHTGSTRQTVACVERAREAGAATIALTSFARSPLTEIVRYALVAGASGAGMELEAVASRIAHIAVIDALILGLASADPERAERHRRVYEQILGDHRF
jgi:RpiR family carbohydrate utilization transcriptional regulator